MGFMSRFLLYICRTAQANKSRTMNGACAGLLGHKLSSWMFL